MSTTSELGFKIPSLARLGASEPARLYFRGEPAMLQKRRISIVGSRKMSVYTKNLILRLARDYELRRSMAAVGFARTKAHYTYEQFISSYRTAYREAAEEGSHGGRRV